MISRELTKKAVHFQGTPRMPHFLPDDLENDIVLLWKQLPGDIQPWTVKGSIEERIDPWGILWQRPAGAPEFGEAKKYPVFDMSEYKKIQIPDYDNDKYYEHKIQRIKENNQNQNPKYTLSVLQFASLFEQSHILVGLDRLMYEFYDHPSELKSFLEMMTERICECVKKEAQIGSDCVMMYDDWGLQDRLIVSRDLIREFFIPCYKKIWGLSHDLGMDTCMHSCGDITGILPDLIDAGLDIVQMDQQENMGLEMLSTAFGGKIAFWCPADIQTVMSYGNPKDVNKYVKRMVQTLGSHNGGLISKFYPQPDAVGHAPENTIAMCKAFREHGVYENQPV